jgi:mono/diheme cytochrome c family protein
MMSRRWIVFVLLGMMAGSAIFGIAQERAGAPVASSEVHGTGEAAASSASAAAISAEERAMRIEGEKRFRANCGRCHMAPHKFAPRIMATAIRHMRVRAMLTDEDMRFILRYMTQ